MTEREIFLAALEKDNPTERAAYLDEAAGADSSLHQRIETLLRSHERDAAFMNVPVVEQLAGNDVGLDFLAPSQKPGSLGRLGHYDVLEVVGQGGMGVVFRALDDKLQRVVAIKALAPQFATISAARQRFVREARAAAAVTHDNVINMHAVEDAGQVPYMVMQFIDGPTLQQKLDSTGQLSLKEILRIGLQIAAGLAAAHRHGLTHRDVKPANILLENGIERVNSAVNGLAAQTTPVTLTMNLGSANYTDLTPSPKANITLVIKGSGGTTTIVGHSPALDVAGGNVVMSDLILITDTNAPTVVVSSGSLTLRNVDIEGTDTGSQAAVEITGGNVDLGTADDPGGNTFDDNGTGQLIHNAGGNGVSAVGNTWQVGGTTLTSPYRMKDEIFDALNVGGGGLVTYVPGNDYVSVNGGDIQLGVNAIAPGGTVNVEAGGKFHNYDVGSKPVTIAFQNGAVLTQAADSQNPSPLSLSVTGTPGDDNILFNPGGGNGGTVKALVDNLPQGVFSPTGRLIAYGVAGNDDIEVAGGITLPAFLYGGDGNDRLKGGGGNNVLIGGSGNNMLIGGSGSDLLIGGSGSSTLIAGSGDDLLIAGTTAYDANDAALAAIMAQWTSGRDYATRIANLSGTGSGPRNNGNYFLIAGGPSATVFDNGDVDVINGGSGMDWFFANLAQDIIHGQRSSEVVESL